MKSSFLRRKSTGNILACHLIISATKWPETCCSKKFGHRFIHVFMTVNSLMSTCSTWDLCLLNSFLQIQKFLIYTRPRFLTKFCWIKKIGTHCFFFISVTIFIKRILYAAYTKKRKRNLTAVLHYRQKYLLAGFTVSKVQRQVNQDILLQADQFLSVDICDICTHCH